jgi:hypothetical protein
MSKLINVSFVALLAFAAPVFAAEDAPSAPQPAAEVAVQTNADVPQSVKDACQGDYEKFCSQHAPESEEVRVCMAGAFEKLSETCVTAILDSPLADQAAQQVEAARAAETEAQSDRDALGAAAAGELPLVAPKAPRVKRLARAQAPELRRSAVPPQAKRGTQHKITVRLARARPAAHKHTRYAAYRGSKPRRSVAGYIRRGTSIAGYYVAKYTRIGVTRAFR